MNNNDQWVEIGRVPTWNFKEDKELKGTYIAIEEGVGLKETNLFKIQKEDGSVIGVWGNTMINDTFQKIRIGDAVKIVYLGMEESKNGRSYHSFRIYHRPQKPEKESSPSSQDGNSEDQIPF